jgi:cytochrome c-type biogenesis protein CcsB
LILTKGNPVLLTGSSIGSSNLQASDNEKINLNKTYNSDYEKDFLGKRINLLQSLDNLSYRTIGLGFPLLTIGIISGAVWANEAWGSYWSWDPKETWALITWMVFAAYLHTRITQSWKGKGPAILASIGFIVVWICYLGVNFLGKGLHSYGWII